jgi:hypothetical protein
MSIQNIGGVFGFSKEVEVRWIRGESAPAEIYNLQFPPRERRMRISSSLET